MQRIKLMTQRDSIVIKFLCLYSCVFARSRVFSLIRMLFHWPTLSLSLSVAFAISLANEIISITLFAESFFSVENILLAAVLLLFRTHRQLLPPGIFEQQHHTKALDVMNLYDVSFLSSLLSLIQMLNVLLLLPSAS